MKTIIIQKRKNPKYLPSYKYETVGYHADNTEWFNTCHKTLTQALDSVDSLILKVDESVNKIIK